MIRIFSLDPIPGYEPPALAGHKDSVVGVFFTHPDVLERGMVGGAAGGGAARWGVGKRTDCAGEVTGGYEVRRHIVGLGRRAGLGCRGTGSGPRRLRVPRRTVLQPDRLNRAGLQRGAHHFILLNLCFLL